MNNPIKIIEEAPVFPDPSESYKDPFFMLSGLAETEKETDPNYFTVKSQVYEDIDTTIQKIKRIEFIRAFISEFQENHKELTSKQISLVELIEKGELLKKPCKIKPEDLEDLLHHPDALLLAHFARKSNIVKKRYNKQHIINMLLKTAAVLLLTITLAGASAATAVARPDLVPSWLNSLIGVVHQRFQFDNTEPLVASEHNVRSSGIADGKWFKEIKMDINPPLPDGTKAKLKDNLGKNSNDYRMAEFSLGFDNPKDNITRQVTIQLIPHDDIKENLENELGEDEALIKALVENKKAINVGCTKYGALIGYPADLPPEIHSWKIEGSVARIKLNPKSTTGFVSVAILDNNGGMICGSVKQVHIAENAIIQPVIVEIGLGAEGVYQVIPIANIQSTSAEEFKENIRNGVPSNILMGKTSTIEVESGQ